MADFGKLSAYLGETDAQDQDTAVSDSFVEAYALISSVIGEVNAAIEKNDIASLDMNRVKKAEKAWFFTSGMSHGLAIDRPEFKEALEYMRKAISSLQASRDSGFQQKVYEMPRDMAILLNFDFGNALQSAEKLFDRVNPPEKQWISAAQKETDKLKEGICAYLREPGSNAPTTVGTSSDMGFGFQGYDRVVSEMAEPTATDDKAAEPEKESILDGSAMDEALKEAGIEIRRNEFGEEEKVLGAKDGLVVRLEEICKRIQLDPLEDGPKIDNVNVMDVCGVNNYGHFVAHFYGGANGGADDRKLIKYIMVIRKLVDEIQKELKTKVWLVDWKNDCCDDVWDLRLGFTDEESAKLRQEAKAEAKELCKEGLEMSEEEIEDLAAQAAHRLIWGGK